MPSAAEQSVPQRIETAARPTREQILRVKSLLAELAQRDPDVDWKAQARQLAGVPSREMTSTMTARLIATLEGHLESRTPPDTGSTAGRDAPSP
jgi:hypothetical protein